MLYKKNKKKPVEEIKPETDEAIADDGMEESDSNSTEPESSQDGSDNEPVEKDNKS
ncbi:hypothetical protein FQA39_LY03167, partial [Lamprigera yunnana]